MYERIRAEKLNSHLYLLDDAGEGTGYLLIGREKALLIDTMNGVEDVHALVRTLTQLPVTVVNTHGHCDHIYGNIYFDGAWINPADLPIAAEHANMPDFRELCEKTGRSMPPFRLLENGQELDLGGLHLQVIFLPGHTPGGVCLLLKEDRILFTGDSINRHLWMQLSESLPVREFRDHLAGIGWAAEQADRILHGHAQGFEDISLYTELLAGLNELVETQGEKAGRPPRSYRWFGGNSLQMSFGNESGVICYGQDKLDRVPPERLQEIAPSFCGKDCAECVSKRCGNCRGCRAEEKDCPLASCAREKKKLFCGNCGDYPCELLKSQPDGEIRLKTCDEWKRQLLTAARRGWDPVAVCGFVCEDNCPYGQWCGGCRGPMCCCSYATLFEDGKCPHVKCAYAKGLHGCWQCPELDDCRVGFFGMENEYLAKASCRFARKYGEGQLLALLRNATERKMSVIDPAGTEATLALLEKLYRS